MGPISGIIGFISTTYKVVNAIDDGIDQIAHACFKEYDKLTSIPEKIKSAKRERDIVIAHKKYHATVDDIKKKYPQINAINKKD